MYLDFRNGIGRSWDGDGTAVLVGVGQWGPAKGRNEIRHRRRYLSNTPIYTIIILCLDKIYYLSVVYLRIHHIFRQAPDKRNENERWEDILHTIEWNWNWNAIDVLCWAPQTPFDRELHENPRWLSLVFHPSIWTQLRMFALVLVDGWMVGWMFGNNLFISTQHLGLPLILFSLRFGSFIMLHVDFDLNFRSILNEQRTGSSAARRCWKFPSSSPTQVSMWLRHSWVTT